jgi:hypothetical protein
LAEAFLFTLDFTTTKAGQPLALIDREQFSFYWLGTILPKVQKQKSHG